MKTKILFTILLMTNAMAGITVPPPGMINGNRIFFPSIRTVQVYREGFEMSAPVIRLHSSDRLVISFDEIEGSLKQYRFTIVHCEAGWRVSENLSPSDYIQGFREENITDFSYSFNTTVNYIHYRALFPTSAMSPLLSGNYLLKVFTDDPGEPAFIWRFMVVENTPLEIAGSVDQSPYPAEKLERQQVNFVIHFNGFNISSPAQELNICIRQNDRWDNMICNLKPVFARGEELDFRFSDGQVFNGGNEYRSFDTKSLRYQSERVARITFDTITQVYLSDDMPRASKPYVLDPDINGRYIIKNEDYATNHETESDYTLIHFSLKVSDPDPRCRYYISGGLTGYESDDRSGLTYNPYQKRYETSLLLKQGYYNYQYVCIWSGSSVADETIIEGNHWETSNNYSVYVYYHPAGGLYDRLVAMSDITGPD